MARKRGESVHGWVPLDKPIGITSTQAVAAVRRLFNAEKAGHAGTLDPMASGLLPVALGEATKTVPFAMEGRKTYRFTVAWGEERDTDDLEGTATATSPARPIPDDIESILNRFRGDIQQTPPAFSAVKVEGARAYDLARAGNPVDLAPRIVRIEVFRLLSCPDPGHAEFEVSCGKGT
jgi:tRNA pseudouridine55 synthase